MGELKITCLSPAAVIAGEGQHIDADENDSSMVLRIERVDPKTGAVFSALFTGDIGTDVEKRIKQGIAEVSYLKVAHHGSRNSSDPGFIRAVSPSIAAISAGIDNSYGHPHKETIDTLTKIGSSIYCTRDRGEIILTVDGDRAEVRGFLED